MTGLNDRASNVDRSPNIRKRHLGYIALLYPTVLAPRRVLPDETELLDGRPPERNWVGPGPDCPGGGPCGGRPFTPGLWFGVPGPRRNSGQRAGGGPGDGRHTGRLGRTLMFGPRIPENRTSKPEICIRASRPERAERQPRATAYPADVATVVSTMPQARSTSATISGKSRMSARLVRS